MRGFSIFLVAAVLGGASLRAGVARAAGANTGAAGANTREGHSAGSDGSGVILVVKDLSWSLDTDLLRAALVKELRRPVIIGQAGLAGRSALTLRGDLGRRVVLTYCAPDGSVIERATELPRDPRQTTEIIALLAGNLARDEASELAAALAKRGEGGAPPPEPEEDVSAPEAEPANSVDLEVKPPQVTPESAAREEPTAREPATHEPPAHEPPAHELAARARPASRAAGPETEAYDPPTCFDRGATWVIGSANVLPFLGTSTRTGSDVVPRYSANLFGGYSAGLAGAELGLVVNVEHAFACGAQLGGVANVVAGPVRGVQMAGALNFGMSMYGAQLGALNVAAREAIGAQVGGLNVAARGMRGAQLGALNVAAREMRGAQLGGLNVSSGETSGAQLGAVNIASGEVKGLQIGLINYADKSSLSLGLINIIRNGRTHLEAWGLESGLVMAGLKHGTASIHTIYGVGVRAFDTPRLAFTLGVGGRIRLSERFYVDLDVLGYSLHARSSFRSPVVVAGPRVTLGARVARRAAIFGGPTYNVSYSLSSEDVDLSLYGSLAIASGGTAPIRAWPGFAVGLSLL